MNPRPRSIVRATLVVISLLSLLTFAAHPARAIQLRWSTGATDLTVTENARAVLLVMADSAEVTLPSQWRLLWTADSSGVQFAELDSATACLTDTARVFEVDPPSTPADSAANQITTHFCSAGSTLANTAYFLVDLVGGIHGKLKVVALDPVDPSNVIASNDVTCNGGFEGEYAPLILNASSERQGTTLIVTAVGSGLAGVRTADIGAPDHAWDVQLAIDASSDSTLVASAEIPVNVPSSVLSLSGSEGVTSTMLPANVSLKPQGVQWTPSGMQEAFTQQERDSLVSRVPPDGRIQPKDFAFLYAGGKFHLFYIRLNMWDPLYRSSRSTDNTEKNLGHAVSTDLNNWTWVDATRDTTVLQVRPGKWDNLHVWAPTIVQTDTGFTMFYTGVHQSGARQDQQIGRATSPDLFNWTRYDTPILTAFEVPWAKKGTVTGSGQQLRIHSSCRTRQTPAGG